MVADIHSLGLNSKNLNKSKMEHENLNTTQNPPLQQTAVSGSGFTRLELGEAWMWCSDCMSKLYSFDGNEDGSRKCPHPQKCADDRNRTKTHYR